MKKIVFLMLVLLSVSSQAQLLKTKSEIIQQFGKDYTEHITDDGYKFMAYQSKITTAQSGTYTQTIALYFFTTDEGLSLVYMWKIMAPETETNDNVKYYNNKFVKIGEMKWKDYSKNIIYSMELDMGYCIVSIYYDD